MSKLIARASVSMVMFLGFLTATVGAQGLGLCPFDFCEDPIESICDPGGFLITLTDYTPAPPSESGFASYTYQVCSPAEGFCTLDPNRSCRDHSKCAQFNAGTCTRQCAVDSFRDLSHFDVALPPLGGLSCLSDNTEITGSCTGGTFVLGPDGSCRDEIGNITVAKCDNTDLEPGQCLEMTINVAGELNAPGLGAALLVSKESTDCNQSCIAGPSCEPCVGPPVEVDPCLTRTRGFWGTHPHLIQSSDERSLDLLPITVCGDDLTLVDSGVCSTSEALCTNAQDRRRNPTYLSLAAQLAAAKLNLHATAAVSDGACGDWMFDGKGIEEWIDYCESNFCGARKQDISASGCIEALDAFNNSQDTGFDQTPAPFDRPGPAMVGECQLARGNGIWVGGGCSQP